MSRAAATAPDGEHHRRVLERLRPVFFASRHALVRYPSQDYTDFVAFYLRYRARLAQQPSASGGRSNAAGSSADAAAEQSAKNAFFHHLDIPSTYSERYRLNFVVATDENAERHRESLDAVSQDDIRAVRLALHLFEDFSQKTKVRRARKRLFIRSTTPT
jgi:hypothetical protein